MFYINHLQLISYRCVTVEYCSHFVIFSIAGFTFNASESISGQDITITIMEASGLATFECQLDNETFVMCECNIKEIL